MMKARPAAAIPIGVVTVSDRASRGDYEDKGTPAILDYLTVALATPWQPKTRLVPDERALIAATLVALVDDLHCPLVLVTGGTGPAAHDLTPEATTDVCQRLLPGFGEAMRMASLRAVPTAILSRQIAGTRGASLIVDLPGRPSAIGTCLDAVFAAIPYCIELLGGPRLNTNADFIRAFRPSS